MSAVRPGYKQTEVGVIPEEWGAVPLRSISNFENGDRGENYPSAKDFVQAGCPFVNAGHLSGRNIEGDEFDYISERKLSELRGGKYQVGDVLFCLRGTLGKFGYVSQKTPLGAIASSLIIVRSGKDALSAHFLCQYFASNICSRMIELWAGGAAQPNLGGQDLARFLVPLPPLPEQQAIAEALGDADALIEALEALIAKKRAIKQGAMQDLLTGQRRLPGFQGEWGERQLGSLGSFAKGSGVKKDEANSGSLPCVRYGELYTYHTDIIRRFNSHISTEVAKGALRLRAGDILFAGSGETKEEIGKCAALVEDVEAYAGGDIVVLRPSGSSAEFLGYYLNMPEVQRQKASKGQGDAVVHISSRALASIDLKLPPTLDEQRAIAAVLSDMDEEIAALEAKLAKARDVKQGMMQVLLTGEIRLI